MEPTANERVKVAKVFANHLKHLTTNSKPLINLLAGLAVENAAHADAIIEVIEKQIILGAQDTNLPVLYLADCLAKHIAGVYRRLFTKKIAHLFCVVFEGADKCTREKMFVLRRTWTDIFPLLELYSLDTRVKEIDPAWPIIAPKPEVFMNPTFSHSQLQLALLELERKKEDPMVNGALGSRSIKRSREKSPAIENNTWKRDKKSPTTSHQESRVFANLPRVPLHAIPSNGELQLEFNFLS